MGNTVCTDVVPFSLEDIINPQHRVPGCTFKEGITALTVERFARIQHNIKAFTFRDRQSSAPFACGGGGGGASGHLDPLQVAMLPMDLSQSKIYLEDTRVYLLIHVQRLPLCPVSAGATTTTSTTVSGATGKTTVRTPSTQLGGSSSQYGGSGDVVVPPTFDRVPGESEVVWRPTDAAPEWASAQSEVFTPRGLASPFSTSVGMPPVGVPVATSRSSEKDGVSGFEFRYSIYIYKGCKAHPMVAAVAAMHAGRIEEKFLSDEETLHRLFFNFNPSSWRGEEESPRRDSSPWSTIGEVTRKRAVRRTTRMCDEFQRNALVRVLCCLRRSSTSRNTLATPNSRGSTSQDCTPRGCTKRKNIIPALSFDYYMLHQPRDRPLRPLPLKAMGTFKATLPVGSGCDAKGRPLLQTSRAHYRALDPSGTLKEELPIPRTRNNNFMSHISNGQGDTSRVSNASSHTPQGSSFISPRFPAFASLCLDGGAAGGDEDDEFRVTEKRMQKLKAAAPHATEVLPWLFVGGEDAARDRAQLLEKGITHVVNTVAFSVENHHENIFRYLKLYLTDSPDEPIFSLIPVVIRFIEEARHGGGKVFIHCHQGVSRSCSFVIAYVMWNEGLCYDRAYELVRARRNVCSPNPGFYVSLLIWEKQLSRPSINNAYAFLPYPEYLFPFSFRQALAFRPSRAAGRHKRRSSKGSEDVSNDAEGEERGVEEDNEASCRDILNKFVQVVTDSGEEYVLDSRLCYGLLLGEREEGRHGRVAYVRSFFFSGSECDQVVRERAKEEWEAFLNYNFYHGPERTSVNSRNEEIHFSPFPKPSQPTDHLRNVSEIGIFVEDIALHTEINVHEPTKHLGIKTGRNPQWDSLLSCGDIAEDFAKYTVEELWAKQETSCRKRLRKEERERLMERTPSLCKAKNILPSQYVTPDVRGRPTETGAGKEPSSSVAVAPSAAGAGAGGRLLPSVASAVRPDGHVSHSTSLARESGATAELPSMLLGTSSLSAPVAVSPGLRHEIEIYSYPFTGPPCTDIIDAADMESGLAYAIVIPASSLASFGTTLSPPSASNRVYLWMGSCCQVEKGELLQAYEDSMAMEGGVRLHNGGVLKSPIVEVVYDGEEPDELLLVLD